MFAKALFDNLLHKRHDKKGEKHKDPVAESIMQRNESPKITQEKKSKDFDTSSVRSPVHLRKPLRIGSNSEELTPDSFMKRFTVEKDDFAKGAYGKVSLATDRISQEKVVIKQCMKTTPIRMIQTEVRAGQLIGNHPNIATFHRYQDFGDHHAMVIQYIDGLDLFTYLEKTQFAAQQEPHARAILLDIINGLKHCHSKGIAHRDMKLENVLIDNDGRAYLIDFGLSGFTDGNKLFRDWVGSDNYIAPELVRRNSYNGYQADVFSAGVIAFALLFGVFPFENLRVNGRHSNDPSKPLPTLKVRFPSDIKVSKSAKDLVLAMLEDDPIKRINIDGILQHEWMQEEVVSPALAKRSNE